MQFIGHRLLLKADWATACGRLRGFAATRGMQAWVPPASERCESLSTLYIVLRFSAELHGGEARIEGSRIRYTVSGFSNRIIPPRPRPSVFFFMRRRVEHLDRAADRVIRQSLPSCLAEECPLWYSLNFALDLSCAGK